MNLAKLTTLYFIAHNNGRHQSERIGFTGQQAKRWHVVNFRHDQRPHSGSSHQPVKVNPRAALKAGQNQRHFGKALRKTLAALLHGL